LIRGTIRIWRRSGCRGGFVPCSTLFLSPPSQARTPESRRAECRRENHHRDDRKGGHDDVAPRRIRPERDTAAQDVGVTRAVSAWLDRIARDRRLGDAALYHEIQMHPDQAEDRGWDQEHVGRVEPRERGASHVVARDDEAREPISDDRRPRRLFCRDHDRPERVLVPPQELPGEGHRERCEEEERPGEPVRFAGELEGSEQIHLRHVDKDEDHHRARPEIVHSAHDRAEGRIVTNELQRVVRAVRCGDIRHRQTDPGIAAGRLHDRAAWLEEACTLGGLDHR